MLCGATVGVRLPTDLAYRAVWQFVLLPLYFILCYCIECLSSQNSVFNRYMTRKGQDARDLVRESLDEPLATTADRCPLMLIITPVCHSVNRRGGVYPSMHWADTPWKTPWADTPQADIPPPDGYCRGEYTSYWNAFLFLNNIND